MKKSIQAFFYVATLLISLSHIAVFAQQKTISGVVFDETKQALPGVSVKVKNTSSITATNAQGKFSISVPDANAILVFTFIGYQSQEIPIAGKSSITVNMSSASSKLNEVVVVGYGTQKKSDLAGAITQLKTSDINATATANIGEALQGRAAGVAVTTSSSPGSSPRIRVRGANSITAGNDPLLVVDGLPMENGNLNDFNSDDIASLEILKDASATAIYGSRGANGVIILTTKKGAAGKNNINFSSYYGIQKPTRLVKLVGRDEFIDFINAAYTNQTGRPVFSTTIPAPNYDTDWQRALLKGSAPIQNYTLSVNGGSEKTKYLLSAGVFSQDGLLQQSGYNRYSLRSTLDQKFNNLLTVGTHLQVNHSNRKYSDDPLSNVFRYGFPTMPVKNPNGSWYYAIDDPQFASYVEGRWNPVADASQIVDNTSGFRSFGDVYAELKFGEHLSFRTNFGADIANNKEYFFAPSTSTAGWNNKGSGRQSFFNEAQYINENILTYDNSWKKHHLTATGVVSYYTHTHRIVCV
jgi:TonB-linked SusC/RagA family outer membrane protein